MPRWRSRLALPLALAVSLGGCEEPRARPDVLLVTVDTTRADHLSCYGHFARTTPHIDAVAARGLLFENAYAPMPLTLPSHASMLTGLTPRRHGVLENGGVLDEGLETLAERMAAAGYRTCGVVAARVLDEASGIAQGFEAFDAPTATHARGGEAVTDAALAWLARSGPDAPRLLWVHYYDPHSPHGTPEGFDPDVPLAPLLEHLRENEDLQARRHDLSPPRVRALWKLYAEEIQYMDAQIGRLLAGLPRPDETLVVIVGDHGEGLYEHGARGHGENVYEEQMRVPLIVTPPGRHGPARVEDPVTVEEVHATILGYALEGREDASLLSVGRRARPRPILVERPHFPSTHQRETAAERDVSGVMIGVLDGRWKLIRGPEGTLELYDLAADPAELTDLAQARPDRRARRDGLIEAWIEQHPAARRDDVELSDERRAMLEALGYLGGDDGGG